MTPATIRPGLDPTITSREISITVDGQPVESSR
jgi:hypothetical protein